jgi:hypothetical protein
VAGYEGLSGPSSAKDEVYSRLRDQAAILIPLPTLAASKLLYSGPCIIAGWSIIEQAGVAAVWDVFDGGDATGQLAGALSFAAGGASVIGPGPDGPYCKVGLFLSRVSGTIRGSIWLKI